jgi:hypothetical protein
MVPSITAILQRFTGAWAALLQPDAILAVCSEIGYTGWRDRVLTPVTTVQLLLQILHGNTACRHLPHLSGLRFSAAAYCQARAKLPLHLFARLLERFGSAVQPSALDEGGGMAIAPFSSMARDAPCLTPLPYRKHVASRRSNGRGVAFLSPGCWGCSMPAPVCSSSW